MTIDTSLIAQLTNLTKSPDPESAARTLIQKDPQRDPSVDNSHIGSFLMQLHVEAYKVGTAPTLTVA